MAFSVSFDDNLVEEGEDKRLGFTPKDRDGNAITPNAIDLTFTDPDGNDTTKQKSDFSQSGDEWYIYLTFDQSGQWEIDVKVTGPNSRVERVSKSVDVRPK